MHSLIIELPKLNEVSLGEQSFYNLPSLTLSSIHYFYFGNEDLPNLTKLSSGVKCFYETNSFSLTSISIIFVLYRSGKADPIEYFIQFIRETTERNHFK